MRFQELVEILAALRGPEGCPWDKAQDEHSIANYFLEEVYEAVDAITARRSGAVAEELGDVLMDGVVGEAGQRVRGRVNFDFGIFRAAEFEDAFTATGRLATVTFAAACSLTPSAACEARV